MTLLTFYFKFVLFSIHYIFLYISYMFIVFSSCYFIVFPLIVKQSYFFVYFCTKCCILTSILSVENHCRKLFVYITVNDFDIVILYILLYKFLAYCIVNHYKAGTMGA